MLNIYNLLTVSSPDEGNSLDGYKGSQERIVKPGYLDFLGPIL